MVKQHRKLVLSCYFTSKIIMQEGRQEVSICLSREQSVICFQVLYRNWLIVISCFWCHLKWLSLQSIRKFTLIITQRSVDSDIAKVTIDKVEKIPDSSKKFHLVFTIISILHFTPRNNFLKLILRTQKWIIPLRQMKIEAKPRYYEHLARKFSDFVARFNFIILSKTIRMLLGVSFDCSLQILIAAFEMFCLISSVLKKLTLCGDNLKKSGWSPTNLKFDARRI